MEAISAYGLDAVCEGILSGKGLREIAAEAGASAGSLLTWIEADAERSARVRETRASMARVWDEMAEEGIRQASDDLGLRKAKELAHHFRWRASKVAPREYGDRIQHANDPTDPMPAPQFVIQPVAPVRRDGEG